MHDKEYKQGYEAGQGSALVDAGLFPRPTRLRIIRWASAWRCRSFSNPPRHPNRSRLSPKGRKTEEDLPRQDNRPGSPCGEKTRFDLTSIKTPLPVVKGIDRTEVQF